LRFKDGLNIVVIISLESIRNNIPNIPDTKAFINPTPDAKIKLLPGIEFGFFQIVFP